MGNKNKVGGDKGAGVGVGAGAGGGVGVGGGAGGTKVNVWLGGGGAGSPLPPGIVPTEAEQAQAAFGLLKGHLQEDKDIEQFMSMFRGRVPTAPEPAPAQTPTEAQRAEHYAQLARRQDELGRRVKEGKERLEAARAEVRQEEEAVAGLEGELRTVADQCAAHKAEDRRREEEARAPRAEEVVSDMDIEGGSSTGEEVGMNQVAGKRRKVVRNNRVQAGKLTREELFGDWFKRQFLGDVSDGAGSVENCVDGDEFEPDKVEFNARAATAPTQEDVACSPCG